MQVVAALQVDFKKYTDKEKVDDLFVLNQDCIKDSQLAFYCFVRDIDYTQGLHVLTGHKSLENLQFNAIAICDPKLFNIP